ncbi:MAG: hypothetical protein K2Y08_03120 [Alphaproteobacteria bacterium]|nr:hypothetical protein [Alphaproteobacteria bacterium]
MPKKQKDYIDLLKESPFYNSEEKLLALTVLASLESKTSVQEKQQIKAGEQILEHVTHKKSSLGISIQALLGFLSKTPGSFKQKRQKKAIALFLLSLVYDSPELSAGNRLLALEVIDENKSHLFKTLPQKAIQVAESIVRDQNAPLAHQRKAQIFLSKNQLKDKNSSKFS